MSRAGLGGATAIATAAAAAAAAAARSSAVTPTTTAVVAPSPAPLGLITTSTPLSASGARLAVVAPSSSAVKPDAPSALREGVSAVAAEAKSKAGVAPPATASAVRTQPVASADNPPNLISSLHSLTSLMVQKEDAPATRGKWDRLAAGGGSTARAVPALRKAEEARLLEEKRVRERATTRFRTPANGQPAAPAQREDKGAPSSAAVVRVGAGAAVKAGAVPIVSKEVASDLRGNGKPSGVAPASVPAAAPLRVTGMLPKLVPGVAAASREVGAAATHRAKGVQAGTRLPAPFRPSTDDLAGQPLAALPLAKASESDFASVRSADSSVSSNFSGVGFGGGAGGGGGGSVASSSDKIEMKIRDQRAQIELKRNARMEKLKAEEEKKKVCICTVYYCVFEKCIPGGNVLFLSSSVRFIFRFSFRTGLVFGFPHSGAGFARKIVAFFFFTGAF